MFYLAARTQDEVKANVNYVWSDSVVTSLGGKYTNNNYPTSFFGVNQDHVLSVGPDVSYSPTKDITTHLFYNYEEVFIDQLFSSSNNVAAAHSNLSLDNHDTIHTVGVKADWQVNEKAKISIEDNLSYGATSFAEGVALIPSSAGVPQSLSPSNLANQLPDAKTLINTLTMNGEYQLRDNISLLAGYAFERASAKDYLYGQAAGSPSNGSSVVSLPGDGNPSYVVHVVSAGFRLKW